MNKIWLSAALASTLLLVACGDGKNVELERLTEMNKTSLLIFSMLNQLFLKFHIFKNLIIFFQTIIYFFNNFVVKAFFQFA